MLANIAMQITIGAYFEESESESDLHVSADSEYVSAGSGSAEYDGDQLKTDKKTSL